LLASLIDVRSRSLEAGVAACWAASVTGIDRQSA
jgi:hypothetical protein